MTDDEAADFVRLICSKLKEKDYAFTVDAVGTPWDVYRFEIHAQKGTIAFRKSGDKFEVGFFRRGSFGPEEVRLAIIADTPS